MIQVLNNILYYLNLAAVFHSQYDATGTNSSVDRNYNVTTLPVFVTQIPPGPISPGIVVKFVCAVNNDSSCISTPILENEVSYQWEMHQFTENKDGKLDNTNVLTLPGQDAEMEIKFNDSMADPSSQCSLVCIIKNNPKPSSASIKLHFLDKASNKVTELLPPSGFKMLEITGRAVYFSWNPPNYMKAQESGGLGASSQHSQQPDITGYVIEYKNVRGSPDWKFEKVSRYEIKNGSTFAACITNLSPWTTYHFRIVSCSKSNTSAPSLPIVVRTAEDLPSAPPQDIQMFETPEKMLQVSWKPPPRTSWNGALLGYNIGLKKASSADDEPFEIYNFNPLETLGSSHVYQIKVSDSSVLYKVVVQAFNNVGSGPFSDPVTQQKLVTPATE